MEVLPLGSAGEIAVLAADTVEAVVRRKPAAVLGLATGSTPLPAYRELTRRHQAGAGPSYAGVTCFNLDEYVGLATAGERYEALIAAAGGVDVQLLGIGADGHLAFNEPGSSLAGRTRIKTLTAQTRADNARFFGSPREVPAHVLTQGLGTILAARHLLLIATGAGKADAVAACVEGPGR